MSKRSGDVQKMDVRPMDFLKEAMKGRFSRLTIRQRWAKFNFWTGSVEAKETTTTVEVIDDARQ